MIPVIGFIFACTSFVHTGSRPLPLPIPNAHAFALLPSAISLIAKTDAMFAPLVVAGLGSGPPAWLPKVVRGMAASAIQRLLVG